MFALTRIISLNLYFHYVRPKLYRHFSHNMLIHHKHFPYILFCCFLEIVFFMSPVSLVVIYVSLVSTIVPCSIIFILYYLINIPYLYIHIFFSFWLHIYFCIFLIIIFTVFHLYVSIIYTSNVFNNFIFPASTFSLFISSFIYISVS